jgi:hypothetical protein
MLALASALLPTFAAGAQTPSRGCARGGQQLHQASCAALTAQRGWSGPGRLCDRTRSPAYSV